MCEIFEVTEVCLGCALCWLSSLKGRSLAHALKKVQEERVNHSKGICLAGQEVCEELKWFPLYCVMVF